MTRRLVLFSVAAVSAWLLIGTAAAGAGRGTPFVCVGNLSNLDVAGDLVVPEGASCDIGHDSTIAGNVWVEVGGSFNNSFDSTVNGNVTAEPGSFGITLDGGVVGGNVRIRDGKTLGIQFGAHVRGNVDANNTPQVYLIKNAAIDGNVAISGARVDEPSLSEVELSSATVGGNVILLDNQPVSYGVSNVQIGGNLICFGGSQITPFGSIATGGQELGQCAGF